MMKLGVIAVCAALWAAPATAQSYSVYGIGVTKCADLNSGAILELAVEAWLGGYISGANELASIALRTDMDMTGSLHIDFLMTALKAICSSNPEAKIGHAVSELVGQFWQDQVAKDTLYLGGHNLRR